MNLIKYTALIIIAALTVSFTMLEHSNPPWKKMLRNAKHLKHANVGLEIGDEAPDIMMQGLNGKVLKLSDLRGKVVLVDFWASWCGPCRMENPNVVEAYNKYNKASFKNGKGFEVFSVSLDAYKEAWQKAVDKDQLAWDYHVSDLKKWNNAAAKLYKINSIPNNFLIDGDGIIVGKNLRDVKLHMAIEALTK